MPSVVESGILSCSRSHLGTSTLKSPFTCQSLRLDSLVPAQRLSPGSQNSFQRHKMELDPPLVVAHCETPAMAMGQIGTEWLTSGG